MAGGTADIGIRVFLDDAALGGLSNINNALGSMGRSALGASRAMGGLSASMAGVGVAVGFGVALLAFGAAIKYSIDAASAFQQSMFSVAVATHVPLDVAVQYSAQLMNLAANSTFTSAQIADGIVQMGRAGYSIHDIFTQMAESGAGFVNVGGRMVPVMSSIAQAGIALGIATRTTAVQGFTLLAQSMAAYNAPASQALHFANLLQFAFEHQRGSVSDLTSGLSALTPQAAMLHIPFNQIIAALDVVGPAMKSTSTAGTALRYAFANVLEPTNLAISALASLGLITVSSTSPAMQKFASQLLATGTVSSDFVRKNDSSVAGLKNLFAAAQQAGLVPLDAKFNEWADSSGMMKNAFFDANGKARDLTSILQILSNRLKGMPEKERLDYLKDIFSVRGGQGIAALLNDLSKYSEYLHQLTSSSDNAGGAMRRWNEVMQTSAGAWAGLRSSINDLAVAIGTALLPVVTRVATFLNQLTTAIRNSVMANPAAASSFLKLGAAMSGVGLVATIVVLAISGVGGGILAFIGIVAGVAAGVVLLTVGIMLLANWFRNLYASSALVRSIIGNLGAIFNEVGAAAKEALAQALETINEVLAQTHFKMSDLAVIGKVLLVVLGTIAALLLGVLVGAIRGVILALAMFIAGLVLVIAGVAQFVAGVLQLFKGLFDVIVGLVTGNGAMVTHGFALMRDGALNILRGLVTAILGLFIGVFGTIIGFIVGFVQGIISWFRHLSSVLVGHSIIPDMLNAIRSAFISVLSSIVGFVGGIINRIIAFFVQLGSRAVSAVSSAFNTVRSVVSGALNAVVGLVGSIFNSIVSRVVSAGAAIRNAVSSAFNTVRSVVSSALSVVVGLVGSIFNSIVSRIVSAGASIRNAVSTAFNFVRAVISIALAAIVAIVSSAWAGIVARVNSAGNAVRSAVSSAFNAARSAAASALAAIVGVVSSGFSAVVSRVSSAGAFIVSRVSSAFNSARAAAAGALASIVGVVSGGMSAVIGRISSAGSSIIATMSNAWNSARNAAASGVAGVVGLAASLPGRVVGAIGGLAGMLYSSGAHAMQSFAAGLQSALGAVVNAVASAAASVASFLHHSAPPTVGPLSNDDEWMPHMIQMMAAGIDRHAPLLKDAINRAAGGMVPGFSSVPQVVRMGAPSPANINVPGGGGSKVVQLVVDGRILGQAVMDDWTGRLQLNGGGRAFR